MSLADGRRLGWAEWGPPGGAPVLLCPGAGTSRRLGFGADVVAAFGVRLICLDRLWYGALDTSPVHSPDSGESLVARIPRARRHLLAQAGGLLLRTHGECVLVSLSRLAGVLPPADA